MSKTSECLLIEDDPDDQEIFQLALADVDRRINYSVANSGKEALKKLSLGTGYIPDVIFIDINMPVMSGIECLHRIKQLPHLTGIRIYMYSTSVEVYTSQASDVKAEEIIVKPPTLAELVRILSAIFENQYNEA